MAGLEGFELVIATSDVAVAEGTIDGVRVAGATLVGTVVADATYLVVYNGSAFELVLSADQVATDIVLGTAVIASDVAASVTYTARGRDVLASADDSITL